jgi:F-type H+-transporting ATPase subunit a
MSIAAAAVVLADTNIKVGVHDTVKVGGLTLNIDTVIETIVAALLLAAIGWYIRQRATSGKPSKLQLFFEMVVDYVQKQVDTTLGPTMSFVVPLAVTLFFFILIANWIELIPLGEHVHAPTADVNLTYAMAIFVIILVHATGFRRNGFVGYLKTFAHGPALLVPLHVLQEFIKPITLALRLFGNIFSGGIMLAIIGLIPAFLNWPLNFGWKLFDMGIGVIQAFIFALLTILYFESAAPQQAAGHADDPKLDHAV